MKSNVYIKESPLVLIYKRTHKGDPNKKGIFGVNDCMGSVRDREYDAVIGIGGLKPWKGFEGISLKVNWIGIEPKRRKSLKKRGPLIRFSKFCLYDEKGPLITKIAPKLYKYMYIDAHRRVVMSSSLPLDIFNEVVEILRLARKCLPSHKFSGKLKAARRCR